MIHSRILPYSPTFDNLEAMHEAVASLAERTSALVVGDHQMERYQGNPVVASMRELSRLVLEEPVKHMAPLGDPLEVAKVLQASTLEAAASTLPTASPLYLFCRIAVDVLDHCPDPKLAQDLLSRCESLASGEDRWPLKVGNLFAGVADQHVPHQAVPIALDILGHVGLKVPITTAHVRELAAKASDDTEAVQGLIAYGDAVLGLTPAAVWV